MYIGIIYNLVDKLVKGLPEDTVADCEVLETAMAVKAALEVNGHQAGIVNLSKHDMAELARFDALFNLAESTVGSQLTDDVIAQRLEETGFVFTGSCGPTLRRCTDKAWTKSLLIAQGLPTPSFQVFRDAASSRTHLNYPLIVKPVHEDGSIGITERSLVTNDRELAERVAEVLRVYRQPALVEEFIDGREINVALLGNGEMVTVLPLSEIVFTLPPGTPRIVSRDAKWVTDSTAYKGTNSHCPADLEPHTTTRLRQLATRAFQTMGCRDYGRVDLRLRDGQLYILEVNPNPCINPDGAGFIVSAQAAGYTYDEIINEIMDRALTRRNMLMPQFAALDSL
jgi:D-alanine-D-alanine ligase